MSVECQVNVKSQSELDIGGRETCFVSFYILALAGYFIGFFLASSGTGSEKSSMREWPAFAIFGFSSSSLCKRWWMVSH